MVESNNAINNTVGASISGVTNTLTVTNPSNTASSAARETITVGGASAGDPSLNFNVSGATDWEMGLDNNDSDHLKISEGTALGTNDSWIMRSGGTRTLPLQPSFYAAVTSKILNVTGDGTIYTIIYNSEQFDIGSNFNTGTGVFTAPADGIYWFSGGVTCEALTAAHNTYFFLISTSAGEALRFGQGNIGAMRDSFSTFSVNGSGIFQLTAGDTASMSIEISGGAKVVDITEFALPAATTFFCGYLLG